MKDKLISKTNEPVMVREVAESEVDKWFDFKKLNPDQRDNTNDITERDENKESLISGFMWGQLTLNSDTGELTQKLKFPPEKDGGVKIFEELKYKFRLNQLEIKNSSIGVKARDMDGKVTAYIAALTDQPRSIIDKLDREDRKITDAIVTYFL